MAIDNAEKRKSISGITVFIGPGVTNNASPNVEWRQESGYGYPGIDPSVVVGAFSRWTRRRRRIVSTIRGCKRGC